MRDLDLDPAQLVKDGSGDWSVDGRSGTIHALPRGFEVFTYRATAVEWAAVKSKLDFAFLRLENTSSGIFWIEKMLDRNQGDALIAILGLKRACHGPPSKVLARIGRSYARPL